MRKGFETQMKFYRVSALFTFLVLALATGFILFAAMVPMDFSVSAFGRIEPARTARIVSAATGRLVSVRDSGTFCKGDILYSQDSEVEKKRLVLLSEEQGVLEMEAQLLRKRIDFEKLELGWKIQGAALEIGRVAMEVEMQRKRKDMVEKISENLEQRKRLDEDLKAKESTILSTLYEKQLIPKIEYLRFMYEKSLAENAAQEAEMRTEQLLFDSELQIHRLDAENRMRTAEESYLRSIPESLSSLFSIETRLIDIRRETLSLETSIAAHSFSAPFDGVVLNCSAQSGDYLREGEALMEIADESSIRFRAILTPDGRREIVTGQKANLYLDSYSFHRYGVMDGKISSIETVLGSTVGEAAAPGTARYIVTILVDKPFRNFESGLTGRADIVTFHGTILKYVLELRK
jgi:multidrug resistance efflux pump